MKRLIKLLLIGLILLPVQALAATYYVANWGNAGNNGTAAATPKALPSQAVTLGNTDVGGDGPHIMYIEAGTYESNMLVTDADWAGGQIIGVKSLTTLAPAAWGEVALNRQAAGRALQTNQLITVKYVTLQEATTGIGDYSLVYVSGNTLYATQLELKNASKYAMEVPTGGAVDITGLRALGASGAHGLQFNGSGYGTLRNVETAPSGITAFGSSATAGALDNAGTGGVVIYDSVLSGSTLYGITNGSTGRVDAFNSIVEAGVNGEAVNNTNAAGVVATTNCLLVGRALDDDTMANRVTQLTAGTHTQTNNLTTRRGPGFVKHTRVGYICPTVDDDANVAYAALLEAELRSRGQYGTLFSTLDRWATYGTDVTALSTAYWAGTGSMEVGLHNYSHTDVTVPDNGALWTVTKAGATINVDRAGNQIVFGGSALTIGSSTTYKDKTLTAIRAAIAAVAGAAVVNGTYYGSVGSGYLSTLALGECLKDTGGAQATDAGYVVKADATADGSQGIYKSEIVDGKATAETLLGHAISSYGPAFGTWNSSTQAAAKTAGFTNMRISYIYSGMPTKGSFLMSDLQIYRLGVFSSTYFYNSESIESTKDLARWFAEFALRWGAILSLISHDATEVPISAWQIMLDVWKNEYPNWSSHLLRKPSQQSRQQGLRRMVGTLMQGHGWTTPIIT